MFWILNIDFEVNSMEGVDEMTNNPFWFMSWPMAWYGPCLSRG